MALTLNRLEAVNFGDFSAMPKVSVEKTLRIQKIKTNTEAEIEEAKDLLASAFEEKEKVREALDTFPLFELQVLQAYLIGGDRMANKVLSIFDGAFNGVGTEEEK